MPKKPVKQDSGSKTDHKAARTAANKARKAAALERQRQRWLARNTTTRGTARAKRRVHLQPEAQQQAA